MKLPLSESLFSEDEDSESKKLPTPLADCFTVSMGLVMSCPPNLSGAMAEEPKDPMKCSKPESPLNCS